MKKSYTMKKIPVLLLSFISVIANAQKSYWQQEVAYTINVTLDDAAHSLKGTLEIKYTNHSPDKLDFIWFHIWPNAYSNEKTAFARQILAGKDGADRWKQLKDKGAMDGFDFSVNNKKANYEAHPEHRDIIKLVLPEPLAPQSSVIISTPFNVKLPTYISRMGHIDQSYIVCQWYPKPAVYDHKGWHPIPYLDMGEFYSDFGKFTVSITVPSAYVVGATGTLQNQDELNHYREIGKHNLTAKKNKKYEPLNSQPMKTLTYAGENIHDFAWFADKDFIIEYDTMKLESGKIIDVFSYHPHYGNKLWDKSTGYIKDAVKHYSGWIGEYPYPVVQAVEGPKNLSSGGMEYPMITLITSPDANEERLDAVITHEVGHNWFYCILGSNERVHAWMDEGMNTYYQFRYEATKYKSNSIFGDALPKEIKQKPLNEFEGIVYNALSRSLPMETPVETHSADFKDKDEYGIVVYIKTAIWMYIIEVTQGRDKLDRAMKAYFNEWKFKHPYPEDFKAALEKETGEDMGKYFELLKKKGSLTGD